MTQPVDHFALLKQELEAFKHLSSKQDEIGYFGQEVLRFYSIAGSLIDNDMLSNRSAEERQISHILTRSLLEGFFWLIYIFDDPRQRKARFTQKVDSFKREYSKFWNEPYIPDRQQLEPAGPAWAGIRRPMDVNTILAQVMNVHGDRLNYLYFTYRVASFDTHGNSMEALFQSSFGKACNFSALNLKSGFDIIANHYLVILQSLRATNEV